MRAIVVPVADRPECAKALSAAFELGGRLGASISGYHIRPHRYSEVSLTNAFAKPDWLKKNSKSAPVKARALYAKLAARHGYEVTNRARTKPTALWKEMVGSPEIIMGIVGPVADLVVVSRPSRRRGVAEMFLTSALLDSSSPVLVLPKATKRDIARRVVIGWNQGSEVARTVRLSLSVLAAADEVTIVSCGPEDLPGPKATQLAAYLKQWGIKTTRETTNGRHVGRELVDVCRERDADLLITGAYSRSRWRERVFGGTTEYLLFDANIPLLTLHT